MSSMVHMGGAVKLTDLQLKSGPYSAFRGYSASKLENVLTARRMNTMISRSEVRPASRSVTDPHVFLVHQIRKAACKRLWDSGLPFPRLFCELQPEFVCLINY